MPASGAKRPFIRKRDLVSTTNEYKTIQFPTGKEIAKPCQSAQARAGRSPRGIRGILDRMKTLQTAAEDVCYRRKSGKYLLVPSISQFDAYPMALRGRMDRRRGGLLMQVRQTSQPWRRPNHIMQFAKSHARIFLDVAASRRIIS
jgi:hypothetical protein